MVARLDVITSLRGSVSKSTPSSARRRTSRSVKMPARAGPLQTTTEIRRCILRSALQAIDQTFIKDICFVL
jgi:hypothetical protein